MEIDPVLLESVAELIGQQRFSTWFADTHFALRGERLVVSAPDAFLSKWLKTNYSRDILKACIGVFGREYPLDFVVETAPTAAATLQDKVRAASADGSSAVSVVPETLETAEAFNAPETPVTSETPQKRSVGQRLLWEDDSDDSLTDGAITDGAIAAGALPSVELRSDSVRLVREPARPSQPREKKTPAAAKSKSSAAPVPARTLPLQRWATFDRFIVGRSNQMAKNIMDLAVGRPAEFNPIFLSGPTSVGKTHLLESVYSAYRVQNKRKAPLFLTSEQFTTLFTQSVRPGNDRQPFLERFRNISLFVLDDVHFLAGKEKTQFELIALIDRLRREGVQMVFSADRALGELRSLRGELVSRLQAGVVCDIKPAERETLLTLFQQAADRLRLPISDEVARRVISRYATDARQLTGIANLLYARYLTNGRPITCETVEETLGDFGRTRRVVRLEDIEKAVAEMFEIKPSSLRGKSRSRECSYPRMLAMWLARKHTRNALSEIGRYFGNRSHSTVISAQKRVEAWLGSAENDSAAPDAERRAAEMLRRLERILIG